jgi:hypothetical protein
MVEKLEKSSDGWLIFFREIAEKLGGACISDAYVNSKTKLRWLCSEGHIWEALPSNVRKGHWCKICGNLRQGRNKASSIESAQRLAHEKKGECISDEYKNSTQKLTWRCANGHEWAASSSAVQQGSWCPICAGKKPPEMAINDLKEIAISRKGQCLSENYAGAKEKLRWQCELGHEWYAIPDSIKRGGWCPDCAGHAKLNLDTMQQVARTKGGDCLSTTYSNVSEKLHWRCAAGHEWLAVAYHVRSGHWCPICSSGNGERVCRDIFEQMFRQPFPKSRPSWLHSSKGRKMELDGYCESLKLAFEYHGHQHYQHVSFFHKGEKSLLQQREADTRKVQLCKDNGVTLVSVPHTIPVLNMPEYAYQALKETRYQAISKLPTEINVADFVLPKAIASMRSMAEKRNGACLSTFYFDNNTKLRWQCANGHEWYATPGSIQQGSWCPKCAGRLNPEDALKQLQELAKSKGGCCLSTGYMNGKEKLLWQCASGHEWEARANNIRGGSWCHECAKKTQGPKRLGLELCQKVAATKGGECLSTEYVNSNSKLSWKCACGHEWNSIPYSVVRLGTWCPKCMSKKRWINRIQKKNEE